MITSDQTEVTIPMVHNMLTSSRNQRSQVYTITDAARKKLLRPMRCGGTDEQGMRCAGEIIEAIVEEHRAPAPLRVRGKDIVTLVYPVPHNKDYTEREHLEIWTGCPNHTAWDDFNSGELYHTSALCPSAISHYITTDICTCVAQVSVAHGDRCSSTTMAPG
jgi:hypothetical protein